MTINLQQETCHLEISYKDGRRKQLDLPVGETMFSLFDMPCSDWPDIIGLSGNWPRELQDLTIHGLERQEHTLKTIPALPKSVRRFSIANFAGEVPELPDGLEELEVYTCREITTLPALPRSLKLLRIFQCDNLTSLPELPQGLEKLDISQCHELSSLPDLPSALKYLSVIMNDPCGIVSLPKLPSSLEQISLRSDKIVSLPELPASLEYLSLTICPSLISIPTLPTGLQGLHVSSCDNLASLPLLPSTLTSLCVLNCEKLSGNIPEAFMEVDRAVLLFQPSETPHRLWAGFVEEYRGRKQSIDLAQEAASYIVAHGHQHTGQMVLTFGVARFREFVGSEMILEVIRKENNVETRRGLIAQYGWRQFMTDAGAELVDQDDFGVLYRFELRDDHPLMMVKVVNATRELDGSFKDYYLMVDPQLRPMSIDDETEEISFGEPQELTARNAVASTFGLRGEEYAPEFET